MNSTIKWINIDSINIAIHKQQLNNLSNNKKIIKWFNNDKTYWRKTTIEKFELFLGNEVSGDVMEIGAGTAWCSALLSKKKNINKVYTVEFDLFSIEQLMPNVFNALDANIDKIQPVLGSFDDIKLEDNSLDFIFGMGAMHHSQNLSTTYKELFRVLKPGGMILISDPAYSNNLSLNDEYEWREKTKSDGSKNKDNGDQKFRLCQWEAHALESGFETYSYVFDGTSFLNQIYSYLMGNKIIKNRKTYEKFDKIILYPYFGKFNWKRILKNIVFFKRTIPEHDKVMLILEKPKGHNYKAMSENVYKSVSN